MCLRVALAMETIPTAVARLLAPLGTVLRTVPSYGFISTLIDSRRDTPCTESAYDRARRMMHHRTLALRALTTVLADWPHRPCTEAHHRVADPPPRLLHMALTTVPQIAPPHLAPSAHDRARRLRPAALLALSVTTVLADSDPPHLHREPTTAAVRPPHLALRALTTCSQIDPPHPCTER